MIDARGLVERVGAQYQLPDGAFQRLQRLHDRRKRIRRTFRFVAWLIVATGAGAVVALAFAAPG